MKDQVKVTMQEVGGCSVVKVGMRGKEGERRDPRSKARRGKPEVTLVFKRHRLTLV